MITSPEVGRYLASLRERAGIRQSELAARITWSAAVLSRVEAGQRSLSGDELQAILTAIGTPEALRLEQVLGRTWEMLERPPIGHPDEDVVWEAECALTELAQLTETADLKNAFARRLEEYSKELRLAASRVVTTEYQVALMGTIGVGKSTAVCRVTGLEIPVTNSAFAGPVLEAGAGGVTICEVHVRYGPEYGLIVEPRTDEDIRQEVWDFAEFLLSPANPSAADDSESAEGESLSVSKEVVRAIRNMSGMTSRRIKGTDGKTVRTDKAKELVSQFEDARSLAIEILSRMNLHERDRRDIWYSVAEGKEPLPWLKEKFEQINNGRHRGFSLPQRIEVVIPHRILEDEFLSVRLVDTKGIDRIVERADLESHFDGPHTISLLCCMFNEAPGDAAQRLLTRAREAGVRNIAVKTSLLVLPRPAEALAVKDDDGIVVELAADGYDLKAEQVEMALRRIGVPQLPVHFFNAREDNPSGLREFLLTRLAQLRGLYSGQLTQVIDEVRSLLKNFETEQVQEVQRDAARRVHVWLNSNRTLPRAKARIHESLLTALDHAYASTIRATVRRQGEWSKLDYSYQLGYGARRVAVAAIQPRLDAIAAIAENVLQDADMEQAWDLIEQAQRVLEVGTDDLLRKVQLLGKSVYTDGLKADVAFWQDCVNQWGAGPGYKSRITIRNERWFGADEHRTYQEEIQDLVEREWCQVLDRVASLLAID